jgi:hypothetical protein
MQHTIYIVLAPHPRWYRGQRIVAMRKRKPKLAAGQVMIELQVQTPNDLFEPAKAAIVVNETNIVRPAPTTATAR